MKIGAPFPLKKARIEIIPLIDIMFFLLAAFMLASLTMIRLHSVRMELPTASRSTRDIKPDILNIAVDSAGQMFLDGRQVGELELATVLSNRFEMNPNLPVYISGDKAATHGSVMRVLDLVRRAGILRVSFAIEPEAGDGE